MIGDAGTLEPSQLSSQLTPAEKAMLWLALPHVAIAGKGVRIGLPAMAPAVGDHDAGRAGGGVAGGAFTRTAAVRRTCFADLRPGLMPWATRGHRDAFEGPATAVFAGPPKAETRSDYAVITRAETFSQALS